MAASFCIEKVYNTNRKNKKKNAHLFSDISRKSALGGNLLKQNIRYIILIQYKVKYEEKN